GIGHSMLRNGRRIRRARRKIRSIDQSRATLARSNRQSAPWHRSNRVRHKLSAPNYWPNESAAKTHGRTSRRSFVMENAAMVLVAARVSRLRRVSVGRRQEEPHRREYPRQGLRGYRVQRTIRDDWPVLCVTRRFVRV